jgi:acetyl esterase/lipase
MTYEIEVRDVEYLRHGDKPLLARVFRPKGSGPFPLIVDLHGGAWCNGDRTSDNALNEPLARSGVVVAALDFRMPPDARYPGSLQDIHYGIRWFKAHATEFGSRADRVGVMGISSGGHQGMLLAMRPRDPRYATLPLPAGSADADATVRCAVMCWPVINPLGRYHYARTLRDSGKPYPEVADRVLPSHDKYWPSETAMAEADPVAGLERGEKLELPPVLYLQGTADVAHPRPHLDRFVSAYRKAGGQVDLELLEGAAEGFVNRQPGSAAARNAIARIIEFVHKQLG